MRYAKPFVVALIALVVAAPSASALLAGDLDPSFGAGGKAVFTAGPPDAQMNALALQSTGRIIAVGFSTNPDTSKKQMTVARFLTSGALDTSFGSGGIFNYSSATLDLRANAVAIDSSDRIVVAGWRTGTPGEAVVIRLTKEGELDGDFTVVNRDWGAGGVANAVAVQPNGRILAAGSNYVPDLFPAPDSSFAAGRFMTDGGNDGLFGSTGTATMNIGPGPDVVHAIAVQPDGSIVLAGVSDPDTTGGGNRFTVARMTGGGAPDTSWGPLGVRITPINSLASADAVALQPDGKVVVAGWTFTGYPNYDFAIVRYLTDGSLDPLFGSGGIKTLNIANQDMFSAVAIQPDGKIVAAGQITGPDYDFGLVRFTADGQLDPTFGSGGIVRTDIEGGADEAAAAALQPDGKILLGGSSYLTVGENRFALARYLGAAPASRVFPVPTSRITSPSKSKLKVKKFSKVAGTAGPVGSVTKVEIAIRRFDSKQLKKKRCVWIRNSRGSTKKVKDSKKKCSKQVWIRASGTTSWSFKLKKKLSVGSYRIYSRATLSSGATETAFTRNAGNFRTLRLTK
jgi:uncharacterized delta-60 repeat protein